MSYIIGPNRTREEPCDRCGFRVMEFVIPMEEGKAEVCPIGVRCKRCGQFHPLRLGEGRTY